MTQGWFTVTLGVAVLASGTFSGPFVMLSCLGDTCGVAVLVLGSFASSFVMMGFSGSCVMQSWFVVTVSLGVPTSASVTFSRSFVMLS